MLPKVEGPKGSEAAEEGSNAVSDVLQGAQIADWVTNITVGPHNWRLMKQIYISRSPLPPVLQHTSQF